MRALLVLVFLASCGEPELSAEARYPEHLNQPSRGPEDNIADIGADAMCEDAIRDPEDEGPSVTGCAP